MWRKTCFMFSATLHYICVSCPAGPVQMCPCGSKRRKSKAVHCHAVVFLRQGRRETTAWDNLSWRGEPVLLYFATLSHRLAALVCRFRRILGDRQIGTPPTESVPPLPNRYPPYRIGTPPHQIGTPPYRIGIPPLPNRYTPLPNRYPPLPNRYPSTKS